MSAASFPGARPGSEAKPRRWGESRPLRAPGALLWLVLQPQPGGAVGVMTNSDDTGQKTRGLYGDVTFAGKRR